MPSFKGKEILDVVHWHNTTLLDGVLERVPLVVGGGVVLLVGGGRWSFVPAVFSLLLSSVGWGCVKVRGGARRADFSVISDVLALIFHGAVVMLCQIRQT